ncbi:MAG: GNAT family N-acetyltransferase [Candidatus Levyibacteriota bacterium]
MEIAIEKIKPDEWSIYKEMRLEMTKNAPQAYGEAYEDIVELTDKKWMERVSRSTSTIFVAIVDKRPAGMTGVYYPEGAKLSHVAQIWGVYVRETYRGLGLGKLLLEKIEEEIKTNTHITKIKLEVTSTQDAAKALYAKMGYEETGILRKEIKVGNEYFDEILMEKMIQ